MIKIRNYNARRAEAYGKELTTVDKMILLRSDPHVHSEFEFSAQYAHRSFSATMREGLNCARFDNIDYQLHPERWDTICIPLTPQEEALAFDKAQELEGEPYDLIGLLSKVSKHDIIKPSDNAVWCSETVNMLCVAGKPEILNALGEANLTLEVTPAELDWFYRYHYGDK